MIFQRNRITKLVALKIPASSFATMSSFYHCTPDVGETRKKIFKFMSVFSQGLFSIVNKWKLQLVEHIFEIVRSLSSKIIEEIQNFFKLWLIFSRRVEILAQDKQKMLILFFGDKLSSNSF